MLQMHGSSEQHNNIATVSTYCPLPNQLPIASTTAGQPDDYTREIHSIKLDALLLSLPDTSFVFHRSV
jgi:hypothetical protein